MNIGVLTGGGDVPGLNPAIRAVTARALELGHRPLGIKNGWAGALTGTVRPLTWNTVGDSMSVGGTLLGTSRTNPLAMTDGLAQVKSALDEAGVEALVAIGGDDTLSVARDLAAAGFLTVGVPKTMDNDVGGTDWTIGFFTAATVAVEAVERLRTTARSHRRVMVLEVMGRTAGWVALVAGLGGAADLTLIPELEFDIDDIAERLERHHRDTDHAVVVVSEGVALNGEVTAADEVDDFGHVRLGGVGQSLARLIKNRTGLDTRATTLGHIQRGGPPVVYDRLLASALGAHAVELLDQGRTGVLSAWRSEGAAAVSLEQALSSPKLVGPDWVRLLCTLQWSIGC